MTHAEPVLQWTTTHRTFYWPAGEGPTLPVIHGQGSNGLADNLDVEVAIFPDGDREVTVRVGGLRLTRAGEIHAQRIRESLRPSPEIEEFAQRVAASM